MQIRPKFGQTYKNTHKRPNKIFAAKPLLKTAKFLQFGRKKAKYLTLVLNATTSSRLYCALADFLISIGFLVQN